MLNLYVILFNVSLGLIFLQNILALGIFSRYRNLAKKYSKPLGSSINPAELMAKYSRIHGAINLKVNTQVDNPALAKLDTLYVSQKWVYTTGLYANFYILWQIILLAPNLHWMNTFSFWQRILYAAQILCTFAALAWGINFLVIAIILELLSLGIAFILPDYEIQVLRTAYEEAVDLCDLDNLEQVRAKNMARTLARRSYLYPLQLLMNVLEFLVPRPMQRRLKIKSIP